MSTRLRDCGGAVLRGLGALWQGALEITLPPSCAYCGMALRDVAPLCGDCDDRIKRIPAGQCRLCQKVQACPPASICAACELGASPLHACVAAVHFAADVETWIHRFKYPRAGLAGLNPAPLAVMRALVIEAAALAPGPPPDLITPIPLHPRRLRARGFNPAGLLANFLARELGVHFDPLALRRVIDTPSQTGLDRRQRQLNVRGAFRARRDLAAPNSNCVWLVDDVVTTGNTLAEAARALLRAGAKRVAAVCVARTPASSPAHTNRRSQSDGR